MHIKYSDQVQTLDDLPPEDLPNSLRMLPPWKYDKYWLEALKMNQARPEESQVGSEIQSTNPVS